MLAEPKPQKRNIPSDWDTCDATHVRYRAPSGTLLSIWIRIQSLEKKIQPLFHLHKSWVLVFLSTWWQLSVNSGEISSQGCEGFLSLYYTSISSWCFFTLVNKSAQAELSMKRSCWKALFWQYSLQTYMKMGVQTNKRDDWKCSCPGFGAQSSPVKWMSFLLFDKQGVPCVLHIFYLMCCLSSSKAWGLLAWEIACPYRCCCN